MEYRLRPNEHLGEEVRRIAYKQIDIAIGELTSARDPHRSVHEARKCFKRVRALLSLVRPALGSKRYKREDKRIRAIARRLSVPRDCQAMIETVVRLENGSGQIWDAATAQSLKTQLYRDRANAELELRRDGLAVALDELADARKRYASLKSKGSVRHLAEGLESSYRGGRRDFRRSFKTGRDEDFHNWRKSAQHHWRHMQLLWHAWPSAMEARANMAYELSQLLGHDHDLSVLMQHLQKIAPPCAAGGNEDFFDTCRERQRALRVAARPRGLRLFAESPRDFNTRIIAYWRAPPVDEISGDSANVGVRSVDEILGSDREHQAKMA